MASETVVSHNSIVSGQFPKHMGWSDEVMRDVDDVLGLRRGSIVTVGDLTYDQYVQLIEAKGYPEARRLHAQDLAGQCRGQLRPEAVSGGVHRRLELGLLGVHGRQARHPASDPTALAVDGQVPWAGRGSVPDYIADDDRFKISSGNSADKWSTDVDKPAWLYPEDGRYHPGIYDEHVER